MVGKIGGSDVFNEDIVELQFLQAKPACFLVIGKPVSTTYDLHSLPSEGDA